MGFSGCSPTTEGQTDEQKNPYFVAGKGRVAARDFKGAIEAFEKALEANPHSALAHFELGVLYEQHGDHQQDDYVSAMYHYNRVIKLRPNEYPSDNARQRLAGCKQELVKAEALAPVFQTMQRDLEKLREENELLRRRLEAGQSSSRPAVAAGPVPNYQGITVAVRSNSTANSTGSIHPTRSPVPTSRERVTPLPPATSSTRVHTVKSGDTAYSIARQYRVRLDVLLSANPGVDPKRIKIGQTLTIPNP